MADPGLHLEHQLRLAKARKAASTERAEKEPGRECTATAGERGDTVEFLRGGFDGGKR